MYDLAKLFYIVNHVDMPCFVAKNVAKLPSATSTDVDTIKVLQEIESVKSIVKLLSESQATIAAAVQVNADTLAKRSIVTEPLVTPPCQPNVDQSLESNMADSSSDFIVVNYTSCEEDSTDLEDQRKRQRGATLMPYRMMHLEDPETLTDFITFKTGVHHKASPKSHKIGPQKDPNTRETEASVLELCNPIGRPCTIIVDQIPP